MRGRDKEESSSIKEAPSLSPSVRKRILKKAALIAEYWHSIPTEEEMREELQLDPQQWEEFKKKSKSCERD